MNPTQYYQLSSQNSKHLYSAGVCYESVTENLDDTQLCKEAVENV